MDQQTSPKMESSDVLDLYNALERMGVEIWIDGGWGVDALLEQQTRSHQDLDIAIQEKDIPKLVELLAARGYHAQGVGHKGCSILRQMPKLIAMVWTGKDWACRLIAQARIDRAGARLAANEEAKPQKACACSMGRT